MKKTDKETYKFRPLHSDDSDFLPEEPLGENLLTPGSPSWRVWVPQKPIIVLGRTQKAEKEINLNASCSDGIPIFKRHGGGGCVVLDEGCLCLALRFRRDLQGANVSDYLKMSSEIVRDFLFDSYDIKADIRENYDLTYGEAMKFLGASLYMPKDFVLYYAVLLINYPTLDNIDRYLSMPSKQPKHRQGRSHRDFLLPLEELMNDSPQQMQEKFDDWLKDKSSEIDFHTFA